MKVCQQKGNEKQEKNTRCSQEKISPFPVRNVLKYTKYRISEEGRRMGGEGGDLLYLFKEFSSIFPSLTAPIASLLSPPQTLYLFPALLYALQLHCLFQEVLKRRLQSSTYITLQFVRFARFSAFPQSCVQVLPVETYHIWSKF